MSSPHVTFQSITGVDVELRLAGAGSRSYAFVIDWHIRFILALAWFFAATWIYAGSLAVLRGEGGTEDAWVLVSLIPALAIYFLYHPVLEIAMSGRTPGKRMAGVRLVTRNGDIPGAGALLLRNVFRLIDALPAFYIIGLISVIVTQQHVRIGDLAAGTLLVLDHADEARALANLSGATGLDPKAADLVHELLDRWSALEEPNRSDIARALLSRVQPQAAAEIASEEAAQIYARLQRLIREAA